MTWTAVLLFCASWVAYLNRVSPCSNAAQTNGIADYLKYRRREDMSCCFENCFCSVKVPTWTLSKYRQTLLVYFLTTSISPQTCIWVCLKIGYIPNELAIFFGDNDQQNHWVFRGTQHFQTNPYLQNVLLPISLGPCPPDPRCQSLLPEWITFAASAPCVSVQVQHLPIPAPWLWNWGRAYVHQWPPWNISQWQSNRRHVPNVKTVKSPKKKRTPSLTSGRPPKKISKRGAQMCFISNFRFSMSWAERTHPRKRNHAMNSFQHDATYPRVSLGFHKLSLYLTCENTKKSNG